MKRRTLTKTEEFELMKIIFDKLLLFAVFILSLGFYRVLFQVGEFGYNLLIILSGIILLVIFMAILAKEYDYTKL